MGWAWDLCVFMALIDGNFIWHTVHTEILAMVEYLTESEIVIVLSLESVIPNLSFQVPVSRSHILLMNESQNNLVLYIITFNFSFWLTIP